MVDLGVPGPVRLTPGVIDNAALWAFTHGQCHGLAVALELAASLPVYLVLQPRIDALIPGLPQSKVIDEELADEHVARCWSHAVVKISNDSYLDITGLSTSKLLLATYASLSGRLVRSSSRQLCSNSFRRCGTPAPDNKAASHFVVPLLASL